MTIEQPFVVTKFGKSPWEIAAEIACGDDELYQHICHGHSRGVLNVFTQSRKTVIRKAREL